MNWNIDMHQAQYSDVIISPMQAREPQHDC